MKAVWFRLIGGVYLPVRFMGFVVTVLVLISSVTVYTATFRNGYSASDDLSTFRIHHLHSLLLQGVVEKISTDAR